VNTAAVIPSLLQLSLAGTFHLPEARYTFEHTSTRTRARAHTHTHTHTHTHAYTL